MTPPADATFWADVQRIFDEVFDDDLALAHARLEAACAGRGDLQREVASLLEAHGQAGGFIALDAAAPRGPAAPAVGDTVGPFRLTGILGSGGMGTVYGAERTEGGFTQRVAVKVLGTPVTQEAAARRFRSERQILAGLQHPHVVGLLDGVVTPAGYACLVMEAVDGVPITAYSRDRALAVHARIRLFLDVLAAVAHAHRHAVVHRDLKPANVLVTGEGVVKVLDFGIAALLDPERVGASETTRLGGAALTPNYASPEQVRGRPSTTSCDVYALGVMLYELLAGGRPYAADGQPLDEVLRIVTTQVPAPPSAAAVATLPYDGRRWLTGDLDAVMLKALAKAPNERYASVDAFAADLGRYLAGDAVAAQPPSRWYLTRKFVARHRAAVASAALTSVAILAGSGVALWQAQAAREQRDRAQAEAVKAQAVARFLGGVFESADPTQVQGEVTARALLASGARRIEQDLAGQPDTQAELLLVMAASYDRLGDADQSRKMAERALALWAEAGVVEAPAMVRALQLAARFIRRDGQPAEAKRMLERALAMGERVPGPDDHAVALVLRELALVETNLGDTSRVRSLYERAIAIEERVDPRGATLPLLHNNLAIFLFGKDDMAGARAEFELAIAKYDQLSGAARWGRVMPILNIGEIERIDERFAEAERRFRAALAIDDETFGRQSTSSAYTLVHLAETLITRGEVAAGRPLLDEGFAIYAHFRPPDHPDLAFALNARARLQRREGRPGEAAATLGRVVRILTARSGPRHPEVAAAQAEQADALLAAHDPVAAEALLRPALDVQRAVLPAAHRDLVPTLRSLAGVLRARGRDAEAAPLAAEAVRIAAAALPPAHSARRAAEALVIPGR